MKFQYWGVNFTHSLDRSCKNNCIANIQGVRKLKEKFLWAGRACQAE